MNGLDLLRLIEFDIATSPLEQLQEEINEAELVRAIVEAAGVQHMPLNTFAEEIRDILNRRWEYLHIERLIRSITEALGYYDDNQRELYEVITGEIAPDRCHKCRELYGNHKVYFIGPVPEDAVEGEFGNGMKGYFC